MNYKIERLTGNELPNKLKIIKNPPKQLYFIGNKELLNEDCFAIVGTRRITEYGKQICQFFSKELCFRKIPIVSGMALGTDTVSHRTVLDYGGKTIAVLGSGFNNIFPKENIELFEEIIKNDGLVITEFEENEKPLKENFPKRNRIVTAISEGILVIEAAFRSGTSITVNNAKEQGKLVFAIPGKLDSCVGVGVNKMIKKGAILTTCVEDIISNYPQFNNRLRISNIKKKRNVKIKDEYIEMYKILENGEKNLDEILCEISISVSETLSILTNMEIDGIVENTISGAYKIID